MPNGSTCYYTYIHNPRQGPAQEDRRNQEKVVPTTARVTKNIPQYAGKTQNQYHTKLFGKLNSKNIEKDILQ